MKLAFQCVSQPQEETSSKKLQRHSFKVHMNNKQHFFSPKAGEEFSLELLLHNNAWFTSYHLLLQVTHLSKTRTADFK